MNHKRLATIGFTLVLLVLAAAACAPAKAADPGLTPQACPTAPSCPTASARASEANGVWFSMLDNASEIKITFDPEEKCTMSGVSSHEKGMIYYKVSVNDRAHATYAVLIQTLDEGKTLADLQAYSKTAISAPSWSHAIQEFYATPGSISYHAINLYEGPIYISCAVSGDMSPIRIADFGPIEIMP